MKLSIFLAISIYFVSVPSVAEMMEPQFRRFQIILSQENFQGFLRNHKYSMAYVTVRRENFRLFIKAKGGDPFPLIDALKWLWRTDTHSIIVRYEVYHDAVFGLRLYGNHNATAQVWTYAELCQGPDGAKVSRAESNAYLGFEFTGKKILAAAWTVDIAHPQVSVFNKSVIADMEQKLEDKWHYRLVFVFDVVQLSNTPDMLEIIGEDMSRHAILIRLFNWQNLLKININYLKYFLDKTTMGPIFFDLPLELQAALVFNNPKFTTQSPMFGGTARQFTKIVQLGVLFHFLYLRCIHELFTLSWFLLLPIKERY